MACYAKRQGVELIAACRAFRAVESFDGAGAATRAETSLPKVAKEVSGLGKNRGSSKLRVL